MSPKRTKSSYCDTMRPQISIKHCLNASVFSFGCLYIQQIAVLDLPMVISRQRDSNPCEVFFSTLYSILCGRSDLIYTNNPPLEHDKSCRYMVYPGTENCSLVKLSSSLVSDIAK